MRKFESLTAVVPHWSPSLWCCDSVMQEIALILLHFASKSCRWQMSSRCALLIRALRTISSNSRMLSRLGMTQNPGNPWIQNFNHRVNGQEREAHFLSFEFRTDQIRSNQIKSDQIRSDQILTLSHFDRQLSRSAMFLRLSIQLRCIPIGSQQIFWWLTRIGNLVSADVGQSPMKSRDGRWMAWRNITNFPQISS
jgi:hypothetical protein